MSNFDSNIIKNPEIFEQNRLAAHSCAIKINWRKLKENQA